MVVFFLQATRPAINPLLELRAVGLLWRPWTLVSYMFLHANFSHIFWNMLGLSSSVRFSSRGWAGLGSSGSISSADWLAVWVG